MVASSAFGFYREQATARAQAENVINAILILRSYDNVFTARMLIGYMTKDTRPFSHFSLEKCKSLWSAVGIKKSQASPHDPILTIMMISNTWRLVSWFQVWKGKIKLCIPPARSKQIEMQRRSSWTISNRQQKEISWTVYKSLANHKSLINCRKLCLISGFYLSRSYRFLLAVWMRGPCLHSTCLPSQNLVAESLC